MVVVWLIGLCGSGPSKRRNQNPVRWQVAMLVVIAALVVVHLVLLTG